MTDMRLVVQTPWTDDERMRLRELAAQGMSRSEIGVAMGRTKNAVHSQMRYLHIVRGPRAPKPKSPKTHAKAATVHRVPTTTLPPLASLLDLHPVMRDALFAATKAAHDSADTDDPRSLSMRGDGECGS